MLRYFLVSIICLSAFTLSAQNILIETKSGVVFSSAKFLKHDEYISDYRLNGIAGGLSLVFQQENSKSSPYLSVGFSVQPFDNARYLSDLEKENPAANNLTMYTSSFQFINIMAGMQYRLSLGEKTAFKTGCAAGGALLMSPDIFYLDRTYFPGQSNLAMAIDGHAGVSHAISKKVEIDVQLLGLLYVNSDFLMLSQNRVPAGFGGMNDILVNAQVTLGFYWTVF